LRPNDGGSDRRYGLVCDNGRLEGHEISHGSLNLIGVKNAAARVENMHPPSSL
jgi:hypothetical protein